MRIRPARAEEIPELIAAYEWLFAPPGSKPAVWDPERAAERLREAIEAESAEVVVAEQDGAIAGFFTIYDDIHSVRFGRRAWVEDLAVDPERRSQGIGKALIAAALDWAREHDCSHMELDSGLGRVDAHRFYEREGADKGSYSFGWPV